MGYSPGGILLKEGYFRFVAHFTWTDEGDAVALARFRAFLGGGKEVWKKLEIHEATTHGYYLIGQRTFIFIGYAKDQVKLESFCSSVIFNAPISAEVHHAIEAEELKGIAPELEKMLDQMKGST